MLTPKDVFEKVKAAAVASTNQDEKPRLPLCHPPKPKGAKTQFSTGKAAASLARGAYSQYVSANVAKSGKCVSPKVRQTGENATGGPFDIAQDMLFQHSHSTKNQGWQTKFT